MYTKVQRDTDGFNGVQRQILEMYPLWLSTKLNCLTNIFLIKFSFYDTNVGDQLIKIMYATNEINFSIII